ncbi:MAG: hypothetical protein OXB95_12095 [Rhodobacteraceae bacterium]|nr:hypothetical protein [Paracoccaceae bacterium]
MVQRRFADRAFRDRGGTVNQLFLRAGLPEVKALFGMSSASDSEVFGEFRTRKDSF